MGDLAGNGDGLKLYQDSVESFDPENNSLKTRDGRTISYEHLVVVPGLAHFPERISGLPEALADTTTKVGSIYDYDSCDKVWDYIQDHKSGPAIFTQPPQPHKCAGAPQKIMWLAWNHWKDQGVRDSIPISFATALPAMFSVPKYSAVLDDLRKERDVEGLFGHNLTSIEGSTATFTTTSGEKVTRPFNFLHATPPQGPRAFVKDSPLADATSGFVSVDQSTTQHTKYPNVWSIGDSSSLPTSKTAAAITAQAPVLVANLIRSALNVKDGEPAAYDGYTSCPLLTEYGKVLLAEFKYGAQLKETFGQLFGFDQGKPSRAFYHLKKDFFPWVYYNSMVKGTWAGPKGFSMGGGLGAVAPKPTVRSFSTSASINPFSPSPSGSGSRRAFSTTTRQQRDTTVRRARDPLDKDPTAMRYPLPSGETLIVRRAPATGSTPGGNLLQPSLHETSSGSVLPPPLSPRSTNPSRTSQLSPEQIAQVQSLRSAAPLVNTPRKLAKQFGCSELFVRIVAPVDKVTRQFREGQEKIRVQGEGVERAVVRAERRARRELW